MESQRRRKVGVLGGAFNPPHLGHLACAREARDRLGLDAVLLVPAERPPHKELSDDPGAEHRAAMCELAIRGEDRLFVSRIELDRSEPSYTVDTLGALHERSPRHELTLIVGSDAAGALNEWHDVNGILRLARVAVIERGGDMRRQHIERLLAWRPYQQRTAFIAMPRLDISSSDLRRRVAEGRSIRHLVPDLVAGYIAEHGLYQP